MLTVRQGTLGQAGVHAMSASGAAVSQVSTIEVVDLAKSYAPGQYAIRGVSLRVGAKDFAVVIGRSGAGKSTLLRCMNLLIRPTHGQVKVCGVDVTRSSGRELRRVRGRIGMIFQGFNLVRRLSVLQNVAVGRLRHERGVVGAVRGALGLLPRDQMEQAYACLHLVGIGHLAFRRADALSGGQQQRVAIARVLAQEPEAILADEPIASLDPHSAESVMSILREIHDTRGIPVVINLHQVDVAQRWATRVIGMAGGSVTIDCPPETLSAEAIDQLYRQPIGAPGIEASTSQSVPVVDGADRERALSVAG